MINNLEVMDKDVFTAVTRHWSVLLSDGSVTFLKIDEDGNPQILAYEDCKEYCDKVRQVRMAEFDEQVRNAGYS